VCLTVVVTTVADAPTPRVYVKTESETLAVAALTAEEMTAEETDSAEATGQMVVVRTTVSVTTTPAVADLAGQLTTVEAHPKTVTTRVALTVNVVNGSVAAAVLVPLDAREVMAGEEEEVATATLAVPLTDEDEATAATSVPLADAVAVAVAAVVVAAAVADPELAATMEEEMDAASETGQTVVVRMTTSVTATAVWDLAGQSVTVDAQAKVV
jgi:hypothetical protein